MDTSNTNKVDVLDMETEGMEELTLSQERLLLKEPDNTEKEQKESETTMDFETTTKKNETETTRPNIINIDETKQCLASASTDTSFTTDVPLEESTSTVESVTINNKRQRKRPSGAQVMKRRRLAMELKALKEKKENGRTDEAKAGDHEFRKSTSPSHMEADGAGNSDTGIRTKREADDLNSKDEQPASSNQTTSHNTSKKKRKRKNKNKKAQYIGNPNGEDTPTPELLNANTDAIDQIATESNSNEPAGHSSRDGIQEPEKVTGKSNTGEELPTAGSKSADLGAWTVNRDGTKTTASGSSNSNEGGPNLEPFWQLFTGTKSNYVPASVMIDRVRSQTKVRHTKAYTPMARTNKDKKPNSEKIEESLRLAIVDVNEQSGGLSELVQRSMEGKILAALDAYLDKMKVSEKPPIFVWSGPIGKAYRIDCLDKRAADWLTSTVQAPNFFPGQKLCVVRAESLKQKKTKLLKVTVWVPGEPESFEVLTKRIGRLNPTLQTSEWVKFNCEEKENGQLVSFGMPEAHLTPLEALECTAFCGTKLLHFRVKKESTETNNAQ